MLEPIGFGFMTSLERYAEARRRYPDAEMMMGIGNITELTAADSTGVNALLIAICQELGIRTVLTTEVIPWARGAVREVGVARQLMHYAITERVVPKHVDDRLVTTEGSRRSSPTPRRSCATCSDASPIRTSASSPIATTITVLNRERFVRGTDIQEIFAQLGVTEATHAFYLGKELARAKLAITLGKTYRQEGSLSWGYLTPPDDVKSEHVRLTQRSARASAPALMIIETIVTTMDASGAVNIAPMGVEWTGGDEPPVLKPFLETATYRNVSRDAASPS